MERTERARQTPTDELFFAFIASRFNKKRHFYDYAELAVRLGSLSTKATFGSSKLLRDGSEAIGREIIKGLT